MPGELSISTFSRRSSSSSVQDNCCSSSLDEEEEEEFGEANVPMLTEGRRRTGEWNSESAMAWSLNRQLVVTSSHAAKRHCVRQR